MKTKILFVSTLIMVLNVSWVERVGTIKPKPPADCIVKKPAGNFSFFRTHRQGRSGIAASWGVSSNQGITGFVLQRTYEFPDEYATWENIFDVGCNNARSYGFVDDTVYPGVINYRVVAMNGSSVAFVSEICCVQVRQR